MDFNECEINSLQNIAGHPKTKIIKRLKNLISSHLNEHQNRVVVSFSHFLRDGWKKLLGLVKLPKNAQVTPARNIQTESLKAGDLVRVKSLIEIKATFDKDRSTKKCGFMDTQDAYCGTVHRVMNTVERFVDERDYKIKKCKGIVLLEDVMCEGTKSFGRCDRRCFIFWREEWLEKIGKP
jgi:hypothetical protein